MKTIRILNYVFVIALGFFAVMFAIYRFNNKDTVYTEESCSDIIGFNGNIPLEINLVNGRIAQINILENKETPFYIEKVKNAALVERFYGLTPSEAYELEIDAVSGATYSSNAIIKSVKTSMAAYRQEASSNPWTWQLFGIIGCAVILCILSICRRKCA